MSPSHKQSEENYEYFYDNIKKELSQEGGFQKVTEAKILDRFLDKKLINIKYHKDMLQGAIIVDKKDEKYDMLSSLLISASTLLFFLIVFIPQKESFIRILFGIYIFCIYLLAYMFY
tara:strand:- start:3544 stop:3894 length:351 start_codon:yes stop_codon:yes gene_type:complete